jgi:hypothetical protein
MADAKTLALKDDTFMKGPKTTRQFSDFSGGARYILRIFTWPVPARYSPPVKS